MGQNPDHAKLDNRLFRLTCNQWLKRSIRGSQGDAVAHHVARRQADDAPGEGILPPGFQRIAELPAQLVPGPI